MKSFIFLASLLTSLTLFAATPFPPEVNDRFNALETEQMVEFEYDVATDGGTIAAHTLGEWLPANAVITRSFFYINTQFTDSGTGTVALSCEDANNIKTATDITGSAAGSIIEGESTGAVSAFTSGIAARCSITATVAGAAQTAGKLTGWVRYVIAD
jgi:hypothetical protein